MRILKKAGFAVALSLTLAMVSPVALPAIGTVTAEAAAIKLSKTKAGIRVGESITLKVTGTAKDTAIQWKSSDASIAAVTKKGKVTGKSVGTSTITATVNKKKYNCVVTVSKASANKEEFEGITFSMPKGWVKSEQKVSNINVLMMMGGTDSESAGDNINIIVQKTGVSAPSLDVVKDTFPSLIKQQLEAQLDIKNYKTSSYKSKVGDVLVASYSLKLDKVEVNQKQYYVFMDQYMVQVTETHMGKSASETLSKQTKTIIDSIKIAK